MACTPLSLKLKPRVDITRYEAGDQWLPKAHVSTKTTLTKKEHTKDSPPNKTSKRQRTSILGGYLRESNNVLLLVRDSGLKYKIMITMHETTECYFTRFTRIPMTGAMLFIWSV